MFLPRRPYQIKVQRAYSPGQIKVQRAYSPGHTHVNIKQYHTYDTRSGSLLRNRVHTDPYISPVEICADDADSSVRSVQGINNNSNPSIVSPTRV